MSLAVEWKVEIGDYSSPTDFTDRVTGMTIQQPLRWMRISNHKAVITLNNFDGALTPAAGGGAGTYSAVDWLSQGVYISATVNTTDTAEVFHGVVSQFELIDDGTSSTVILTVVDVVTLLGRYQLQPPNAYGSENSSAAAIDRILTGAGPSLPTLGETGFSVGAFVVTDDDYPSGGFTPNYRVALDDAVLPQYISELLVGQVMPAGLSLVWAARIKDTDVAPGLIRYDVICVGPQLNRVAASGIIPTYAEPTSFTFVEDSPAAGELTFTRLEMGYNIDDRYNSSSVTTVATYSGTKTFAYNDPNLIDTYGEKQYRATQTLNANETSTASQAQTMVNRFGPVVFTVNKIELTTANLADNPSTSKEELAKLLDAANLWQRCDVEYTPTGAAGSITVESIIFGRQINAQPGRTSIVLDLVPAELFTSFILNSSTLGVLDTDRLG